LYTAPKSNSH